MDENPEEDVDETEYEGLWQIAIALSLGKTLPIENSGVIESTLTKSQGVCLVVSGTVANVSYYR